ncbi:G-protein coupled receptor moody [Holothuria leucospilota]|uniref:G-protein coupled receptor moody n=1 Tax=Holothuria leucospilota TaxID=206669 RepID=A0A9Q0YPN1_HOLLE|nr:G-protein coupled receptor moody [Holothuria leucospilota]
MKRTKSGDSTLLLDMDIVSDSLNQSSVESKTMELDFTGRTTVAVFFIVSAIIGIIGNIFVIFGVSISKKLWNSTGVLISNLAVADLLACLVVPWHAATMLSEANQGPPFPQFICGTIAVMVVACVGCSMYTLAVIGINRMMLLSKHPAYDFVFQSKILVLIVIILWALPLSITLIPLTIGLGKVGYNDKFRVCTQMSIPRVYDKILMLGLCPIPYITIVFCYWKIYVMLSRHTSKMANLKVTEPPLSSANNLDVIEGKCPPFTFRPLHGSHNRQQPSPAPTPATYWLNT